jgi:glycine/D-amino acid oxidase-like deaminating enzyme
MIDVVVVGAGAFGLAVGRELIRLGRRVHFVSADVPGRRGASAADTRVARLAYGRDEFLTQSAVDGLAAWKGLEQACGQRLFAPTGVLHLLPLTGATEWDSDSAATLAALGVRTREIEAGDLPRLCPAMSADGLAGGLLECDSGVLLARTATTALHRLAVDDGAETVIGVARPTAHGVEIDGDRLDAATVVWAVGAELAALFPGLGGVETRAHDSYWLAATGRHLDSMPAWLDRSVPAYGVPEPDGRLKFAPDVDRSPSDPAPEALPDAARAYLAARFPTADLREIRHETCRYTVTPDDDFVVGPVPGADRHWVVGGDSGHGFKHALAWGRHAARAIAGESEPSPRVRLERLHAVPASIG